MDSNELSSQIENIADISRFLFEFSDDRNFLLENGYSKYGCSPEPVNEYLGYSSATASNISWEQAEYLYTHIKGYSFNENEYSSNWQALRDLIRATLGLDDCVDIVFGASGTDLEYISTLFGVASCKPTVSYSTLPDETGSGSFNAVSGKHFSNNNNFGKKVSKNT